MSFQLNFEKNLVTIYAGKYRKWQSFQLSSRKLQVQMLHRVGIPAFGQGARGMVMI
jgi:hypothetical protein